jgi:acetylornithine/succinyldiaminopimelate/putrescine aminotransferase
VSKSRFLPSTVETRKSIADFVTSGRANMLFASCFVNVESAQLGLVLSRLVSRGAGSAGAGSAGGAGDYHSFFTNSSLEALAGAVKLCRHRSVRGSRADDGWILMVDPARRFTDFWDPLGAGPEKALAPHIRTVGTVAEAAPLLAGRLWSGVVVALDEGDPPFDAHRELLDRAAASGATAVLADLEAAPGAGGALGRGVAADVHVLGENVAGRQVPFGCFTMSEKAYAVWDNPVDTVAHTSTFGGNGLCLTIVLDVLRAAGLVDPGLEAELDAIAASMPARLDAFRRYVNSFAGDAMAAFGLAVDIVEARGSRLRLADGRTVLDCTGGAGANLRGHNPPDIVPDVLDRHDPDDDHRGLLAASLSALTGFSQVFPAVSGATAVEAAMTLAMLANPDRPLVLTFDGNYSGKTLGSMNLSKRGPLFIESDRDAFKPYYHGLVFVDPFAADAAPELEKLLRSGRVGLVWFELTQGVLCRTIPREIVDLVGALKDECGYLIGVDEVLTGVWRHGEPFLAHQGVAPVPGVDVVAMAKALSDMTMPVGAALATDAVAAAAERTNPGHVETLRTHFRHDLGAHIARHALEQVSAPESVAAQARRHREFRAGLERVVAGSGLFEGVVGPPGHVRLQLSRRWFPFHSRSRAGQIAEAALSELILIRSGVLIGQLRFFPPVFGPAPGGESDLREVVDGIEAGTRGATPLTVYRHAGRRLVPTAAALARRRAAALRRRRAAAAPDR